MIRRIENESHHNQELAPFSPRVRLFRALSDALLLIGLVLLFYVGGLYAQVVYEQYAAHGDSPLPAPGAVTGSPFEGPATSGAASHVAAARDGQIVGAIPNDVRTAHESTVTRLVIPSIGVDSKVIEVGWKIERQAGQPVAVWQVAEYVVGQQRGSANPGEGSNIVLAGHVGGYGQVFKDLFYVKPGDPIILYSAGRQYRYTVQERLVLPEDGVSAQQQAANERYIEPTSFEAVTLVTCWPGSGPNRFTQRVVVRAVPSSVNVGTPAHPSDASEGLFIGFIRLLAWFHSFFTALEQQ